jgi:hypothetical protein
MAGEVVVVDVVKVSLLLVSTAGLSAVVGFFFFQPETEHTTYFILSSLMSLVVVIGLGFGVGWLFFDFLSFFSRGFNPIIFSVMVGLIGFFSSLIIKDQIEIGRIEAGRTSRS